MKANCARVFFFFFWRIRLRQPVCSYTPITIIRRISWAGLSVHNIYFYQHIFVRIFFASIIDTSIKLVRSFPWEWKFPHYFKTISTVMFPLWLKSRFPSALVALLWQAAFDFPKRLFHEFLSKNQANHNLPFVKYRMQDLGWRQ